MIKSRKNFLGREYTVYEEREKGIVEVESEVPKISTRSRWLSGTRFDVNSVITIKRCPLLRNTVDRRYYCQ